MIEPLGRPLRVRLIGKLNGVGLSRSAEILARGLTACGCETEIVECGRSQRRSRRSLFWRVVVPLRRMRARAAPATAWDMSLMLEHIWPQYLRHGALNVLVPHPEWLDRRDRAYLPDADRVWTLTGHATEIFAGLGRPVTYIGFDSQDRYDSTVPRQRSFLHLAGRSPLKGTDRLLSIWARHPQWPQLTVIHHNCPPTGDVARAANIRVLTQYLADSELRHIQNTHRFHLCPSEGEGWGHYIVEALSVGAITVTTDAAPMNELVHADRGVLLRVQASGMQHLTRLVKFDQTALEAAVESLMATPDAQLEAIGTRARQWYLDNSAAFTGRLAQALRVLQGAPGGSGA